MGDVRSGLQGAQCVIPVNATDGFGAAHRCMHALERTKYRETRRAWCRCAKLRRSLRSFAPTGTPYASARHRHNRAAGLRGPSGVFADPSKRRSASAVSSAWYASICPCTYRSP